MKTVYLLVTNQFKLDKDIIIIFLPSILIFDLIFLFCFRCTVGQWVRMENVCVLGEDVTVKEWAQKIKQWNNFQLGI